MSAADVAQDFFTRLEVSGVTPYFVQLVLCRGADQDVRVKSPCFLAELGQKHTHDPLDTGLHGMAECGMA